MDVEAAITIEAPAAVVWSIATDIEGSPSTISGIEEAEILERPPSGFVGLKWRETRTIGGSKAVETMWITEADEGSYYPRPAATGRSIEPESTSRTPQTGRSSEWPSLRNP